MAYCNVYQFKTKKLLKARNITNILQVEQVFKSSAYYKWNTLNVDSEGNSVKGFSLSLNKSRQGKSRRKNSGITSKSINNTNIRNYDMDIDIGREIKL